MRFFYFLAMALGLSLLAGLSLADPLRDIDDGSKSSSPNSEDNNNGLRLKFKMPEFFNFDRFKVMFGKHYSSLVEEIVRQKIFLRKCLDSFISTIKYKYRKVSHFLRINQMSDETAEEIAKRYPDPEKMRIELPEGLPVEEEPALEKTNLQEVAQRLDREEQLSRRRRSVEDRYPAPSNEFHARDLPADKLMEPILEADEPEEVKNKMRFRVPGNNPEQALLELASSDGGEKRENFWDINPVGWLDGLKRIPIFGSAIETMNELYSNEQKHNIQEASRRGLSAAQTKELPDRMYIDHREKNCHFLPRNQGQCGSCYAFATIALFEYIFCRDTGVLVPFSEQYHVDCGHRQQLSACDGGRPDFAVQFAERYGLELRAEYPYSANNQTCPYDDHLPPERMGTMRVDSETYKLYKIDFIDRFLEEGPVFTALKVTPDFSEYGGGVDDAPDCNGGGHAMLVVGYGREDGKYFYLFRNSHSIAWGDAGYYKLNAASLERCAINPYIFITRAKFTKAEKNMNKRNSAKIKGFHNVLLVEKHI